MLDSALRASVLDFIKQEKLPPDYLDTVERWFMPMTQELLQKIAHSQGTVVVGVSGCQGSGKSTLASLLVLLLKETLGLRAVNLSMDDFYLTHAERQQLARNVHPLLATRGVPGTHDVALALATIDALKKPGSVAIPRFDKSIDDRASQSSWPRVAAPVDVVVLEGWCLSIGPQAEDELLIPVNPLEQEEDAGGDWRRYVNDSIRESYASLYGQVDYLVMLKAPDFDKVFDWRQNQEDKLLARMAAEGRDTAETRVMSREQLQRFIRHYERVTRHGLDTLPASADVVFELTDRQTIARRI